MICSTTETQQVELTAWLKVIKELCF